MFDISPEELSVGLVGIGEIARDDEENGHEKGQDICAGMDVRCQQFSGLRMAYADVKRHMIEDDQQHGQSARYIQICDSFFHQKRLRSASVMVPLERFLPREETGVFEGLKV